MEERIIQILADVLLVLNVTRLAMRDVTRIVQMWREMGAKTDVSQVTKDNQERD